MFHSERARGRPRPARNRGWIAGVALIHMWLATGVLPDFLTAAPNGIYAGVTSQGRPFELTVAAGAVTGVRVGYEFPTGPGDVKIELGSPVTIDNDAFSLSTQGGTCRSPAVRVTGRLSGKSASGNVSIDGCRGSVGASWNASMAVRPVNDDFEDALVMEGVSGSLVGSNTAASLQVGEPVHGALDESASVWWKWTAPEPGVLNIDTGGSNFAHLLELYTGSTLSDLEAVGEETGGPPSYSQTTSVPVVRGERYYVAVSGSFPGNTHLNWSVEAYPALVSGQAVSGQLSASSPRATNRPRSYADRYSIVLQSPASVTIDLSSQDFDAYLYLLDETGAVLRADGGGFSRDPRIVAVVPAGTYLVEATTWASNRTGDYGLLLQSDATPRQVFPGETIGGALTPSSARSARRPGSFADRYYFVLDKQTIVQIDLSSNPLGLSSDAFGEYLYLLDAFDDVIRESGSRIVAILSPGTYVIEATTSARAATGAYRLGFIAAPDPSPIAFGQPIAGTLTPTSARSVARTGSYADRYGFALSIPTVVQIDLSSGDFDAYLYLLDGSGRIVRRDNNSGAAVDSRIVVILNPGVYIVEATTSRSVTTGAYSLRVVATPSLQPISIGEAPLSGTLTLSSDRAVDRPGSYADRYQLVLPARASVGIHFHSADFGPYMHLLDAFGRVIRISDDAAGVSDASRIEAVLDAGVYLIQSTTFDPDATGRYTLSVNEVLPGSGFDPTTTPDGESAGPGLSRSPPTSPYATELLFAQLATGAEVLSSLNLANPWLVDVWGTIDFIGDDGRPVEVGVEGRGRTGSLSFVVPPQGSLVVNTDDDGPPAAGWVRVRSSRSLAGVLRLTVPGMRTAEFERSAGAAGFTVPVRKNHEVNSGIAIVNLSDEQSVSLILRDSLGLTTGVASLTLPANGHLGRLLDELFPAVDTADFEGTLTVVSESGGGLAGLAMEINGLQGSLKVLPLRPLP